MYKFIFKIVTVTPDIALVRELPVVDTLQGHPFNRHLESNGVHI